MRVGFTAVNFRSASEDDWRCSVVNVKLQRMLLFRQGEIRRGKWTGGNKKPF